MEGRGEKKEEQEEVRIEGRGIKVEGKKWER